jgi:hypothetical protein
MRANATAIVDKEKGGGRRRHLVRSRRRRGEALYNFRLLLQIKELSYLLYGALAEKRLDAQGK